MIFELETRSCFRRDEERSAQICARSKRQDDRKLGKT